MQNKDYSQIQIKHVPKGLLKAMCEKEGVSMSGLVAAIMFTLDGRNNYGEIKIDWAKVRRDYPAPMQLDRQTYAEQTERLEYVLSEYDAISIIQAGEEAKVDKRILWTIVCFLIRNKKLIKKTKYSMMYMDTLVTFEKADIEEMEGRKKVSAQRAKERKQRGKR